MAAPLPLADLRVLDLTVARAGPTCVRQLADWGADVVRIDEPAQSGSGTIGTGSERRRGSDYQHLHRNKRSLTLNLKTERGRELLLRLVDTADVLVENMRPEVKARLGFDYETVHARNPRLVYGSISGFGQDGPYSGRGGVDQIAQGMGGLMSVTGLPGNEPTRVGIPVADLSSALYLAIGILVALHERERTGEGRWVTTSLLESMIAMLDFQAVRWTVDGEVPVQEGNHHPTQIPMGCFRSADGYVNVAGPSGRLWHRLCAVLGLEGLTGDPRFSSAAGRSEHRDALNGLLADRLATKGTAEWVELLNAAGVPAGPVYAMDEVFADPGVAHLSMVETVEHPELGELALIRNAVRMTGVSPALRSATPGPGQHSAEILAELGLGQAEVDELARAGVI
ncbi:MAG TPA: CaiB/BaiF CoA-transferase family protein [Acidimicrobiales bacterium]|nr:CaiB/BaiF CoA-transferase family protein [Acidimicrobiales bacterium]